MPEYDGGIKKLDTVGHIKREECGRGRLYDENGQLDVPRANVGCLGWGRWKRGGRNGAARWRGAERCGEVSLTAGDGADLKAISGL
jgi:hypothetical protein